MRPAVDPRTTAVGIRVLAGRVSSVLAEVVRTGRPTIVTKHGAPFAAIIPIEQRQDTALAAARDFVEDLAASDAGTGRTRSSREVLAELARFAEALSQPAQPGRPHDARRHASHGEHGSRASRTDDRRGGHGPGAPPTAPLGH